MALQTKIRETKHYVFRVTVCDRLEGKDLKYANKTFDHIMRKVRKGKITPRPANKEGTYSVHFRGIVYVYAPHSDGTYTIITVYDKNNTKEALAY